MLKLFTRLCALAFVLQAVAAIPSLAAEPAPLDAYGELPNVEGAAISPDGNRIATIAQIKGQRTLLFLDSELNLLRSALLGDVKSRSIQWAGNDAVLLIMTETVDLGKGFTSDRFEATRVLYIPLDPAEQMRFVFSSARNVANAVFGRYGLRQLDGEWYGYFGAVELERNSWSTQRYVGHARPALYQVRLRDDRASRLAMSAREGFWRSWLVDGQGQVAATFDMSRETGSWSLDSSKKSRLATGVDRLGNTGLVALGENGTTIVYAVEDQAGEATRYFEIPLDGGAGHVEILRDESVDRFYVDRSNDRLIGYLRGGEKPGTVFFDPARQAAAEKVARAFARFDLDMVDWTPDFGRMLVRTSGNGDSGTWYMVDIEQLSANAFGVERPSIGPDQVGPISVFRYTAGDGLEMDGILTLPPGREAKDLPVVIYPHGGPTGQDDPEFNWWAQALASRGYAVFQPNFRGSTNRTESFRRAGNGEWGRRMQTDLSDGMAALATEGIIDPSRACIMGASYGGYAALAGVTLQQGLYRCAVAVAPVSDLKLMYDTEYSESGESRVVRNSLLEQLGPRSNLEEISPRRFAHKADAPILLIHGRDDTVVPFEQSQKMADALKDSGKPYRLVDLGNEDHWLSLSETRKRMLEAALAFVQEHNPAD